jgi:tetratricopeptide (TPR) repeat protein
MNNRTSRRWLFIIAIVAALAPGLAAKAGATNNLYLAIPGASWSLEIDTPGFTLRQRDFSEDGTAARLTAENQSAGIILSAFLEKAAAAGGARQCRAYYWNDAQKSPMKKDDLKMSETGSVALVEYIVKEYRGIQVNQKNINAYLSQQGYWVDVHISKADFVPADEVKLQAIVKSIRFNDHFAPTPAEWATWGCFFLSQTNYAEAVRCNEKAWELEQSHPTLSRKQQVFLLNNLIVCHGNLGNNGKAKALSEMGLRKEPDYPSFYYDLACAEAELGNKAQALASLKKALQNKSKLFSDDELPDPKTDSSFSKYARDPEFVKLVSDWNK